MLFFQQIRGVCDLLSYMKFVVLEKNDGLKNQVQRIYE